MPDPDGPAAGLASVLDEMDLALGRISDRVPWASRSGNIVVRAQRSGLGYAPPWGSEIRRLFDVCESISMGDVDAGWFVHPLREAPDSDPFVPRRIVGTGECFALGSDGGGAWLVVLREGSVMLLPASMLDHGVYEPWAKTPPQEVASSVFELVDMMRDRAVAASRQLCD